MKKIALAVAVFVTCAVAGWAMSAQASSCQTYCNDLGGTRVCNTYCY